MWIGRAKMPEISTWISGVSTFIAILAFFRNDIARWHRKRKSEIRFYPIGYIEIGYSSFGPTIGIIGSFWPFYYDQFIKRINLEIERDDDNAHVSFSWHIFKSAQATFDLITQEEQQTQIEGAFPFLVSKNYGTNLNTLFVNNKKRRVVQTLRSDFLENYQHFYQQPEIIQALQQSIEKGQNISAIALYNAYVEQHPVYMKQLKNDISREFWWKAGTYKAKMRIHSEEPEKTYVYKFNFEITQRDESYLFENVDRVLMETAGVKPVRYNFIYPEYITTNEKSSG